MRAVIAHVNLYSTKYQIVYAARIFAASERNYVQLEKKAYSLVYGIWKFHQYLYVHKFTLCTDHKPHYHSCDEKEYTGTGCPTSALGFDTISLL